MSAFLNILDSLAEFSEIISDIKSNNTPISISGVSDSVRAHLIFCTCEKLKCGGLILAHNENAVNEIYSDLSFFAGSDRVFKYCGTELMFHDAEAKSHDVMSSRFDIIKRLVDNNKIFIVTSPEALFSHTISKSQWTDLKINLKVGDDIELDELSRKLISLGYRREEMVEG
ncbi:MAG: hypothetical protein MJ210_04380, partial [Alphaproteobacteria bacterium]|nr:hypothetical protein [Alphaproteobacteria bacterium]